MNNGAQSQWLEDGRRLHMQNGPIDLIVEANGDRRAVQSAYQRAILAFQSVLNDLVDELDYLRTPLQLHSCCPQGVVARKMYDATMPHLPMASNAGGFVTPMIAVAGSVADYILQVMLSGEPLQRAYVNNGGDIALFLDEGEQFDIAICDNVTEPGIATTLQLKFHHGIRGIATSGWRGRSYSLGVADAVTVLASDAASADVAATIIANGVNVPDSSRVKRVPASDLSPDIDLGDTLVTVAVDTLNDDEVQLALRNGYQSAQEILSKGLIRAAYISLQGKSIDCGEPLSDLLDASRPHYFKSSFAGEMRA